MSKGKDKEAENCVDLPKNIQQIGTTGNGVKIYLEDYSSTYLRRILGQDFGEHGILLGKRQTDKKQTYLFVQAVIGIKPEKKDQYWKYNWNQIYEVMQRYFIEEGKEKPEILGWAFSYEDGKKPDLTELEQMHKNNFENNMTLAFALDNQDGKEQFYILENNRFREVEGYYIYYDKYKPMQDYVIENQPGPCVETEAIIAGSRESYRSILKKRKEFMQRRQTVSILYVASTFLIMIVIVLGVTTMNNYDKMKKMQTMIDNLSTAVLNEEPVNYQEMATKAAAEGDASLQAVQAMSANTVVTGQASQITPPMETQDVSGVLAGTEGVTVSETPATEDVKTALASTEGVKTTPAASEGVKASKEPAAPKARSKYEIQPGDTLASISMKIYNTDQMVDKICAYNGIEDGDQIVAGDVLILP